MHVLHEIASVRQIPGEPRRRWFTSPKMDLFIWYATGETPSGFQLCYDKQRMEHALNWDQTHGFSHLAVDDGENGSVLGGKMSPVLRPGNPPCNADYIRQSFALASTRLPPDVQAFVTARLVALGADGIP